MVRGWPNVGTIVRRWANVGPTYIAVWRGLPIRVMHTTEPPHLRAVGLCAAQRCAARLSVIQLGCVEGHRDNTTYSMVNRSRPNKNLYDILLIWLFVCPSYLIIYGKTVAPEPAHQESIYAYNESGTSLQGWPLSESGAAAHSPPFVWLIRQVHRLFTRRHSRRVQFNLSFRHERHQHFAALGWLRRTTHNKYLAS